MHFGILKFQDNEGKGSEGTAAEGKYRKKRASQFLSSEGGGGAANRYRITTRVTTKTKLPKLGFSENVSSRHHHSLNLLHHAHVQTDQFLEDLAGDVGRENNDAVIQTDPISLSSGRSRRLSSRDRYVPMKSGIDVGTQVLPGELASTDEEIQPVLEALVSKILHQSLLETMEEEELAALKEQQNKFQEKRRHEERLLRELQEQHERITREKVNAYFSRAECFD
jgi:hypothetical protein